MNAELPADDDAQRETMNIAFHSSKDTNLATTYYGDEDDAYSRSLLEEIKGEDSRFVSNFRRVARFNTSISGDEENYAALLELPKWFVNKESDWADMADDDYVYKSGGDAPVRFWVRVQKETQKAFCYEVMPNGEVPFAKGRGFESVDERMTREIWAPKSLSDLYQPVGEISEGDLRVHIDNDDDDGFGDDDDDDEPEKLTVDALAELTDETLDEGDDVTVEYQKKNGNGTNDKSGEIIDVTTTDEVDYDDDYAPDSPRFAFERDDEQRMYVERDVNEYTGEVTVALYTVGSHAPFVGTVVAVDVDGAGADESDETDDDDDDELPKGSKRCADCDDVIPKGRFARCSECSDDDDAQTDGGDPEGEPTDHVCADCYDRTDGDETGDVRKVDTREANHWINDASSYEVEKFECMRCGARGSRNCKTGERCGAVATPSSVHDPEGMTT